MGYWEDREKAVHERTIAAYNERRLPHWFAFTPYIKWIQEPRRIPHIHEVREMRRVAQSVLKQYNKKHPHGFELVDSERMGAFRGYGSDAEIVYILYAIVEELTDFSILSFD